MCLCFNVLEVLTPLVLFYVFFDEGRGAGERDLLSGDVLIVICMYS